MNRTTAASLALGFATLVSAPPGLAQEQYRSTDVQRVARYKEATIAFEKALGRMKEKDTDGALDALVLCFERMPEYPEGHFLKARILYSEKEFTRALAEVLAAREGHEKVADLREEMNKSRQKPLRERIKSKEEAIYGQKVRLTQVRIEERRWIEDKILQLERERDELVSALQEWSGGPVPIPAAYSTLHGNVLLRLERPAEAIERYEEALSVDAGYGEAANNLASIYHTTGQHEKAMKVVKAAKKKGAKLHPELEKSIEAALAKRP